MTSTQKRVYKGSRVPRVYKGLTKYGVSRVLLLTFLKQFVENFDLLFVKNTFFLRINLLLAVQRDGTFFFLVIAHHLPKKMRGLRIRLNEA